MKVDYPTTSEEYRYDKAGNRMEKWVNGSMAEQYAYDAANRMVSRSLLTANSDGTLTTRESHEYAYDPQGNMLSDGKRSFTYDAANRLSHVTTQDGSAQVNRYDGEGLRAEMEENGRLVQFLFDGDKVVAETDCEGTNIRYIRGYELISSDCEKARTYYHYASDELGSITHITDEAGNVCNHYEYDAFGDFTVREETVANRFGFTGEQYDPVAGLYYLRARFYNPVIGRFIQEDTYYGDGLNLYAYCGNNPVRYVDPSGHKKECPIVTDIGNQLRALGFDKAEIEKLAGDLNGKWKKTKEGLLKKLQDADSIDIAKQIINDFYNKKPSRDSQILSRNLIKYLKEKGIPIPDFPKAAHHIVGIHAKAAKATRDLLKKYGIGDKELNSAMNGVFLPTDPLFNPKGSTLHIGSHKGSYHNKVYEYLSEHIANIEAIEGRKATTTEVYALIDDLRNQLLDGTLSLN